MGEPVHLIMPMAGRGSRFADAGYRVPKPLIPLHGRPFFDWAVTGIIEQLPDCRISFVILEEHQREFGLADAVRARHPQARIAALPDVTSGALETALAGLDDGRGPIIINDCDHAFGYSRLPEAVATLTGGDAAGFLSHFHAQSPNFSYARYDDTGALIETAEKRPISDRAIAGIYGFASAEVLREAADKYRENCPYPELFVSGVYNELAAAGARVEGFDLDFHVPFGTPEELAVAVTRPELLRRVA